MTADTDPHSTAAILPAPRLDALIGLLWADGYDVRGPVVRDGAIAIARLADAAALPRGWTARQAPGAWRLEARGDAALFGFTHGAESWKSLLHPARTRLWSADRDAAGGFTVCAEPDPPAPYALFGVRGCDLRAIAVQDKLLRDGPYGDAVYAARRGGAFIVAVDCAEPAGTCFCVSMGSGPRAGAGHDLALTELAPADPAAHRFVVRSGSARGAAVLARLDLAAATPDDLAAADGIADAARAQMGRTLNAAGARGLLATQRDSAHWQDVAQRCLTCANCTMVCPTCFCTTVQDTSDLTGDHAERWRQWDSCFTFGFSHMVDGPARHSPGARYRHWISHKLSTWHDQFGESGCVGCGRCIAWCPVGIDITAEIAALEKAVS